jgi:hypothetical protein
MQATACTCAGGRIVDEAGRVLSRGRVLLGTRPALTI